MFIAKLQDDGASESAARHGTYKKATPRGWLLVDPNAQYYTRNFVRSSLRFTANLANSCAAAENSLAPRAV